MKGEPEEFWQSCEPRGKLKPFSGANRDDSSRLAKGLPTHEAEGTSAVGAECAPGSDRNSMGSEENAAGAGSRWVVLTRRAEERADVE